MAKGNRPRQPRRNVFAVAIMANAKTVVAAGGRRLSHAVGEAGFAASRVEITAIFRSFHPSPAC